MFPSYISALACGLILLLSSIGKAATASPHIVASIKPLHSIAVHLTQGVSQPELLLEQEVSAHHFQLKPSQKKKLNQADLFIYSSDQIESFVAKQKASNQNTQFIELAAIPGLDILPSRDLHHHDHPEAHTNKTHSMDGHIWLSISNVIKASQYLAQWLIQHDPDNQATYAANLLEFSQQLQQLKKDNQEQLKAYRSQAFLVYHDAYQYFEQENNLQGAHFITSSPEVSPGIKRVRYLKQLIKTEHIQCVFYEPPNIPPLMQTITEDLSAKLVPLDPLGLQLPNGKDHYLTLMQQTAQSVYNCLSTTSGQ